MIYLPREINNSNCAYVYDKDTIRVYEEVPRPNATINYTDYFIHSDYITRSGSTTFNAYSNLNYNCLTTSNFTTNAIYRMDITSIVILAFIFTFVFYYLIRTLLRRLLYGRKIH